MNFRLWSKTMKCGALNITLMMCFLFTLTNCNSNTNPVIFKDTNIVINSSFEEDGHPSLNDWIVDSTQVPYFDNDVPPGGGKWSLYLKANWYGPLPKTPLYFLPLSSGEHIINLSVWGKFKSIRGSVFLLLKNDNKQNVVGQISIENTTWTKYSLIDTVRINSGDSLFVLLFGGGTELVDGSTYFDLVEFRTIDSNN